LTDLERILLASGGVALPPTTVGEERDVRTGQEIPLQHPSAVVAQNNAVTYCTVFVVVSVNFLFFTPTMRPARASFTYAPRAAVVTVRRQRRECFRVKRNKTSETVENDPLAQAQYYSIL
jgi:hypothetical protein